MRHNNFIISTKTLQEATGANFYRILDRDTALESTYVQLQDGERIQVFTHMRHIVISTQQAQKSIVLHDVHFVCHMCADLFTTYIWIRFEKYGQFPVEWAVYRQNPTFLAPCGSIWSSKKFGVKTNRFLIHLLKSLLYIYKIPLPIYSNNFQKKIKTFVNSPPKHVTN